MTKRSVLFIFIFVSCCFIPATSFAYQALIPHITGTGGFWRDYLQVNNNDEAANSFTLTLYDRGRQVYQQAFNVNGLSQFIIDLKTIVPNIESGCGVIHYTSEGLYFRLSYEEKAGGGVAEFRLTDDANSIIGFYFSDFSPDITWKAIAISNLNPEAANVKLYALGNNGVLDSADLSIDPYSKEVGIYKKWFSKLDFKEIKEIVAVSVNELCGIAISGNNDNSFLLFTPALKASGFGDDAIETSAYQALIPHISGTGGFWRDYLQVNNNDETKNSFILTLYDKGTQVYQQEFIVDGLSQFIIDLKTIVPNIASGCGVIDYTSDALFFRISYEEKGGGGVAEFRLPNEQNTVKGFYFSDFTPEVAWKAIAVTNLNPDVANIKLYAVGIGGILDCTIISLPPYSKEVGLYTKWFQHANFYETKEIIGVSDQSLCGITISGNSTNSFLLFTDADLVHSFDPPRICRVRSNVFSDKDDMYPTGKMVRIDIDEAFGPEGVASGTIRITSVATGYDSGVHELMPGSIFYHWDTTGLEPANDYVAEINLVDTDGKKTTDRSLVITLTPNLPSINKLVSQVDISVPAFGIPVSITRTYLLDSAFNGPLGFGWAHSYLMHVVEAGDGLVKVFDADGSGAFYRSNHDGTYTPPKGEFRELTKSPDGTFQLREKSGTRFRFDQRGKLADIEDKTGNLITLHYDENGLLTIIRDASSQETTFSYDANRRLTAVTDPAGRTVSYGYDSAGDLISVTDIGGMTTHYAYDADHNLTTITDPAGRQTFFTIDTDDRLESVSNAGGNNRQTFDYGVPASNDVTVTDAVGNPTIFTYNNYGLATKIIYPSGDSATMAYDADFNLISNKDPAGNQTLFTYDAQGNLLSATDALGNTVTLTYEDRFHQVSSLVDPNGNATRFEYDDDGNLVSKAYPNGHTENFSYDGQGNLTSLTDANGNTTNFEYDMSGRLVMMIYPDGTSDRFGYDAFGNLTAKTDRMGRTINYVHDASGRIITKSYPDNTSDHFNYDPSGQLLSAEDENGTIHFGYDGLGRLARVNYPGGEIVSYDYDAAGNRSRLTYPDGMVLDYAYNALNRLVQINESGFMAAAFTYDPIGRVIRRELKNGTYSTYSYDPANRLLELINSKSNSEIISRFAYTYDNVGNRLTMATIEGVTRYIYDDIYQLTEVVYPDGSATSYNLDPAGNRISEVVDGNPKHYATNNLNQYTNIDEDSYTYNANGNMTSKTSPSGTTVYSYDFDNRLVQVDTVTETITYTYDPFGRRTSKTTVAKTTNYIHDGFRVIMEKDDSGTIEAKYIHGIGIDEVLVMDKGGIEYFYSQDGLGSVTGITSSLGDILESYSYTAYGVPRNISLINPYLFTGREYQAETRLSYYRSRYYDPAIGRFLNADPIGIFGGLNLYSYVLSNPVNYVDPTGLAAIIILPQRPNICKPNCAGCTVRHSDPITGKRWAEIYVDPPFRGRLEAWTHEYIHARRWNMNWDTGNANIEESVACRQMYFPDWQQQTKDFLSQNNINLGGNGSGGKKLTAGDPTFIQSIGEICFHKKCKTNLSDLIANISLPLSSSLIRANVPIFGQAYGKTFKEYRVEYGIGENPSEWFPIHTSTTPQTKEITSADLDDSSDLTIHGNLATWDTGLKNYVYLPSHPKDHPIDLKGTYTIRLVVTGTDGSTVEDRVTVDVANVIPNAWGGKVTSKDGRVVLSVPEQAIMDAFRLVLIDAAQDEAVAPPPVRHLIGKIYRVREPGERFSKEALLSMAYDKAKIADIGLDRLGIYGYDPDKNRWEYLDSKRDEQSHLVYAKVRELHPYYALMASETAGEGSVKTPKPEKRTLIQKVQNMQNSQGSDYILVRNTFEEGTGDWSNRDNEVGATVALDNNATFDGTRALKITNTHVGGNFAVNVVASPFDASVYPMVQFDYRIPSGVKTNFLVKVSDRWYDIGFTDDPKELTDKRVNIAHIGDIENVVPDDRWHTVRFNLYDMLRTKTGNTRVEAMIMADWDVDGYMKLTFGNNPKDATYYIDNFMITKESLAGLRAESDRVLIDNFNQMNRTNALGGACHIFSDQQKGSLTLDFDVKTFDGKGRALQLQYDVPELTGYAGYTSNLQNIDLRGFQRLTILVKGDTKGQDCSVGIKDRAGNESKVALSRYLPGGTTQSWQPVKIPLVAFAAVKDWGHIENISFGFEGSFSPKGIFYLDDVAFQKVLPGLKIDDFENADQNNTLGKTHQTFASGNAAINGTHAKGSPNGIYRISYGGNIGKIRAYASDLKSFAGWRTDLGGADCSQCQDLAMRVRGAEGGENFTIYLGDGNFRWGVDVAQYANVTDEWQTISIPLTEFSDYGVNLTHLDELQVVFEGHQMSGTVYLDDIFLGPSKEVAAKQ